MYNRRLYDSSWTRNASSVKENGTMGRYTSASPPPVIGDGTRRPIRDRLQNITSAMSWIKEELESLKEEDKTLINIFKKVQGDVKELNGVVASHRSSSSLPGTPATPATMSTTHIKAPPPAVDTSLELDFDALDDELSESGEHKESSLSITPSPPLGRDARGLSNSGTSYTNFDLQSSLDVGGSRDNLVRHSPSRNGHNENGVVVKVNGIGDKESTPGSPTGAMSLSLGSLDLDLDFTLTRFDLGTITEGRSLMNIPMSTETSSSNHSSASGNSPVTANNQGVGLQRSISQQPLQPPNSVASKGRNMSYQPPKKIAPPPQVAPKPRRGSNSVASQPPSHRPPSHKPPTNRSPPSVSKVGRQTSEVAQKLSPQQARKEMMKSTPALFSSPPRTRRNTDSLPRPVAKVMMPLLPFQAQQELREAARQIKSESSKKSSNGVIPQMQQGSPILIRKGGHHAGPKQSSPPLLYRGGSANVRHSPKHLHPAQQQSSPMSSHLSPGMKASLSMSGLSPSVSRAQEETSISRNSSMDSGIQYSSEGEGGSGGSGGGGAVGEKTSNASTISSGAVSTLTSDSTALSGVSAGEGEGGEESEKKNAAKGLGDFSDILSVIANMGGGDSLFS